MKPFKLLDSALRAIGLCFVIYFDDESKIITDIKIEKKSKYEY